MINVGPNLRTHPNEFSDEMINYFARRETAGILRAVVQNHIKRTNSSPVFIIIHNAAIFVRNEVISNIITALI